MKIEIRERPYKTVLLWMSREEAADEKLTASLKPRFAEWKKKNYLPIVFESGEGNLEDSMYMLMKRNLEVLAKDENSEIHLPSFGA